MSLHHRVEPTTKTVDGEEAVKVTTTCRVCGRRSVHLVEATDYEADLLFAAEGGVPDYDFCPPSFNDCREVWEVEHGEDEDEP